MNCILTADSSSPLSFQRGIQGYVGDESEHFGGNPEQGADKARDRVGQRLEDGGGGLWRRRTVRWSKTGQEQRIKQEEV